MRVRLVGILIACIPLLGASPDMKVQVHSDMLTVQVRGVALSEVLEAIEEQANVKFTVMGENKIGEVNVSDGFTNLALEQGIVRLLARWDYALVKDKKTKRLKEVYILTGTEIDQASPSMQTRRSAADVPGTEPQANVPGENLIHQDGQQGINMTKDDQDLAKQLEVLPKVNDFQDAQALEVLRQALQSINPEVRLTALEIMELQKVRDRTALEVALQLSISDPHPEIRGKALKIMRRYGPNSTESTDLRDEDYLN